MIAFLGTGLLGHNFVRAMLKKGKTVQVWNRTISKAKALEEFGAKAFDDPAMAVKGAKTIHIAVMDDEVVDAVLAKTRPGLSPGTIIVDHTTTSVEGAKKRTEDWKARGFLYQHAPVFMGPVNALESTGFMLVSGDPALIERLEPELSGMTGKLLQFGSEPGKAAAMKLLGNNFLVCFTAGLADTLFLANALEVSVSDVTSLLESWNPSMILPARLKRIASGDFEDPSWGLSMARKDVGLFMKAVEKKGKSMTVIPAVANKMDALIAEGNGNRDWTIIGKQS
ncbi:MAG TPA: NAD(P)-dependent oxidoreductase [Puia sp.]|nr:NAD(P)-dependent oxidoreductase [Puia sp.]